MKSIEKYLTGVRKRKKVKKGFKTSLDTCKVYLNNIKEFLDLNYADILKRLQSPMGPSAKEMLKFMRDYDDDISQTDSEIETVNLVLPIEIYEKFQLEPVNKH